MAEINLAVLEERLENLKSQLFRLMAHVESEQRVSENHDRRIESHDKWINRMQVEVDSHEKLLMNGEGLTIKMDRITRDMESLIKEQNAKSERFQWTLPNIIALLSLLSTIGLGVLMFMKGI
jgi:biopolymer transport protein ExbB/TolQ